MTAFYNEIEPYAAQWLRNLIDAGHIAPGVVDERDIRDIGPDELAGFAQCHFFAGIGVWSLALRLAGWPDERPVWTGSCPCQPFSTAGKGGRFDDERHLWPAWFHLIEQRRPVTVFGEQVASKDGYSWLDLVQDDMEGLGYAIGPVVLPAAGVGAPHIRHRTFFVADARCERRQQVGSGALGDEDAYRRARRNWGQTKSDHLASGDGSTSDATNGFWRDADWLFCRDGKRRAVEPGTFPLAYGTPARVGRLRACGNAIVPQVASEFIAAFLAVAP